MRKKELSVFRQARSVMPGLRCALEYQSERSWCCSTYASSIERLELALLVRWRRHMSGVVVIENGLAAF